MRRSLAVPPPHRQHDLPCGPSTFCWATKYKQLAYQNTFPTTHPPYPLPITPGLGFVGCSCHQSPSAAGSSAGTEDKKSPSTTASISGDESPGDSTVVLSAEGSEGGVSVDGRGAKEGPTSGSAEATSSTTTAAPAAAPAVAPASGETPAASAAAVEDGAAVVPAASRWGGKKSFLDVSRVESSPVAVSEGVRQPGVLKRVCLAKHPSAAV